MPLPNFPRADERVRAAVLEAGFQWPIRRMDYPGITFDFLNRKSIARGSAAETLAGFQLGTDEH